MEDVCFVFWCAATELQLGYARHVHLCLDCVRGHVEQAFISLSLGALWPKIKIVAVSFVQAIHNCYLMGRIGCAQAHVVIIVPHCRVLLIVALQAPSNLPIDMFHYSLEGLLPFWSSESLRGWRFPSSA